MTEAVPPSRPGRLARFAVKHPHVAALVLALLAVILTVGVVALVQTALAPSSSPN